MAFNISKTQIDRLGDRLRKGNTSPDDLRLLDEYRRSFADAYDAVVRLIRQNLNLAPTGRPEKSTTSISEKLRRESIRLTQIQDVAGCRLVVAEIGDQEIVTASLLKIFPDSTVADRRQKPSHGYRAVHVIANTNGKAVEIQIRTVLQHAWAELSEKLSDLMDPGIKYGGGDRSVKELLSKSSTTVARYEGLELKSIEMHQETERLKGMMSDSSSSAAKEKWQDLSKRQSMIDSEMTTLKKETLDILRKAADEWAGAKRRS